MHVQASTLRLEEATFFEPAVVFLLEWGELRSHVTVFVADKLQLVAKLAHLLPRVL